MVIRILTTFKNLFQSFLIDCSGIKTVAFIVVSCRCCCWWWWYCQKQPSLLLLIFAKANLVLIPDTKFKSCLFVCLFFCLFDKATSNSFHINVTDSFYSEFLL